METTKPVLLMNGGREPAAKGPMRALVVGGVHYIERADKSYELFDLKADVEEKVNMASDGATRPVILELQNLLGLMIQSRKIGRLEGGQ
jgi:hypothetical protein